MTFIPSKLQQDVFQFIEREQGNAVISAVAGSGKTTTIVKSLELIPTSKKILFLAFNKHIVEELKPKVPSHVEVSTLHSLGWSTLRSRYRSAKLDSGKLNRIFWDEKLSEWELSKFSNAFKSARIKIPAYASTLIKIVNLIKLTNDPTESGIRAIMSKYLIQPVTGLELVHAHDLFRRSISMKDCFDFTDMLYVPFREELFTPKYDFVFVDEAQDLNKLQISIAKSVLKPRTGRFVAVGDPYQSIYGFAGADPESYNILKTSERTTELPLSICYRCAKSIVQHAKSIVPHIQECDTQIDGEVHLNGKLSPEEGDWVLCRNNSPLVTLYFQLLKQGKTVVIKGNDIGQDLLADIDNIEPSLPIDLFDFYKKQISRLSHAISITSLEDKDTLAKLNNELAIVQEKNKIFRSILESIEHPIESIEQRELSTKFLPLMKTSIKQMFSDDVKGIVLCTAHKSKGLEADNVFIVRPDLFPSKFAILPWQLQQETNLKYVAITRAKKTLTYVQRTTWDDTKVNKK